MQCEGGSGYSCAIEIDFSKGVNEYFTYLDVQNPHPDSRGLPINPKHELEDIHLSVSSIGCWG